MVNCTVVENKMGHITVTFPSGKSLYLQADDDIAAFAVASGLIKAAPDWDGLPSNLGIEWDDCYLEDIHECPEEYEDNAV